MPQFGFVDIAVLVVYFLGTIGLGFYFHKRSTSTEGFTAGDRSLPGILCGLSMFATYLSSLSFIGIPAMSFSDKNWGFFTFSLSLPITTIIAIKYFMPYYRASQSISAYANLEDRFGTWARVYASVCYLLTQIARMGAVMYLTALPLSLLLGWNIELIIIVVGISVTLYTFVGGIVAVIWTDAIQSVVLIGGALICTVAMLFGLPDGPGQVFSYGMAHGKFSLGDFGPSLTSETFWIVLFFGIVMNLQNFGIDQNFIQRYKSAKSDKEAFKSLIVGGLLYIPVSALFFFIGTTLYVYYQAGGGSLPPEYAAKPDYVFPFYIIQNLPIGLKGLLIAAIFAAAMSTVSTSLNSSATLLMNDYYKRFFNKAASEKQMMKALYVATVVWGTLGTIIGLLMIAASNAFQVWQVLAGILSGGMLGILLLGMISKKASNSAAIPGAILGVLIILWMTISNQSPGFFGAMTSPFHNYLIPIFGTLTILVVGLLISNLKKKI